MEKKAQLTADFLRDALTGDGGGRRVTATCASPDGETFVVTAERTRVYGAPFAGIPREAVLSRLGEGQPLLLGGEAYSILGSFRDRFAVLLEKCARDPEAYEEAFSVTIEGRSGLLRLYAIEVGELTTHALRSLPADLAVIRRAGSTRDGRERGRKVGGAAKDLAALRLLGVTLEDLRDLEASGNEEALAAIDKDRVFPPIPLDELRTRGIPPAVAYLFTAIHRSFPRRPPPSSRGRSVYVSYVPRVLRKALEAKCVEELQAFLISVGFHFPRTDLENREALGAKFWNLISFARISSSFTWERACEIQAEPDPERAWELASRRPHRDRDGEGGDPDGGMDGPGRGAKPLPARRKRPLDEIRRVGPPVTAAGPEDLIDRFGFTGIEFGNWVEREEGRRHLLLIAGAFQDLQEIVGLDLRRLARSGNLALALGSRGKGSACAHYEPLKRVINLTRTACDGSVAHEFAHFLDHLAGLQFGATLSGESILSGAPAFLSEENHRGRDPSAPAEAMVRLLAAIENGEVEEEVASKATDRWYDPKWILRWLEEAGGDPQAGLDRICFMFTPIFREGRKARDRSVCLVDSMARSLQKPLRLRIRYQITTGFVEQARALGGYWRRRHELFARAFESLIEDELHSRSRCNEYLVDDTRKEYEGCRGSPYPRGDERARIQEALRGFLETLRDRWGQASS